VTANNPGTKKTESRLREEAHLEQFREVRDCAAAT
jgi:hypothetical protein